MADRQDHLLQLAGQLATVTRALVGGEGINGGGVRPAVDIENARDVVRAARKALDEYDAAILEMARRKSVDG